MRHPEFPVVSFLSILILGCSLPSHIRAGSVCTLALVAWLATMSLIRGVNALIWANNFEVKLEVWCDIVTKIPIGFSYAVPAAALCILRHLENVASTRQVLSTAEDKRRRKIFEACMCFGIPVVGMALHYVVQGHRFDLLEDLGCAPTAYFSVAAVFILWVPPMVMSLITFGYAAMAIKHFLHHRIEFTAHLRNSQSAISPGRYFRLMALAVVEMIWDTGVNAYIIYFNTFTGLRPWISWENVHSNFSRVQVFPRAIIPPEFMSQIIWQWWIVPVSCIFFFIFFGFGEEAMTDYKAVFIWFRRNILQQSIDKPRSFGSANVLPLYQSRPSNSYNVDITLRTAYDDTSEHDAKAWDELSLKMPKIADHVALPRSGVPDPTMNGRPVSLVESTQSTISPQRISTQSFSFDEKRRSTSTYTLESSSSTAAGSSTSSAASPTHGQDAPIPSLTFTRPDSHMSSPSRLGSSPPSPTGRTRPTHPPIPREPSPAFSYSSSDRRSMSSAQGIIVSPAYFSDGHNVAEL